MTTTDESGKTTSYPGQVFYLPQRDRQGRFVYYTHSIINPGVSGKEIHTWTVEKPQSSTGQASVAVYALVGGFCQESTVTGKCSPWTSISGSSQGTLWVQSCKFVDAQKQPFVLNTSVVVSAQGQLRRSARNITFTQNGVTKVTMEASVINSQQDKPPSPNHLAHCTPSAPSPSSSRFDFDESTDPVHALGLFSGIIKKKKCSECKKAVTSELAKLCSPGGGDKACEKFGPSVPFCSILINGACDGGKLNGPEACKLMSLC